MSAKLQRSTSRPTPIDLLRSEILPTFLGPGPHLRYANLDFGASDARKRAATLIEGLRPPGWTGERTFRYLEHHQREFRRCLEWLSTGSQATYDQPDEDSDEVRESAIREKWYQKPEVNFLQRHALDHGRIGLQPSSQDGTHLSGLALGQKSSRDPLDPLCGYVLSLLMWRGTTGVRRCKDDKCGKYFNPLTARKMFCSSRCRANAHSDGKSLLEKRNYMRTYRAIRRKLRKSKTLSHRPSVGPSVGSRTS
jgi:hypothetical protein